MDSTIKNNIKTVKDKIVATNQVFKLIRSAKDKLDVSAKENQELASQIIELKAAVEKSNKENLCLKEELTKKASTAAESNQHTSTINSLEAEVNKYKSEVNQKNMYIQQLEARANELKEACEQQKSESGSSKVKEKHKQELLKKNNEIKALQSQLKESNTQLEETRKEVQSLQSQNASLQEEVNKLDEENMVLKIEKDMDSLDEDDDDDEEPKKKAESSEEIIALRKELEDYKEANSALIEAEKERTIKMEALKVELKKRTERNIELEKAEHRYHHETNKQQVGGTSKSYADLLKENSNITAENKRLQDILYARSDDTSVTVEMNHLKDSNKQLKRDIAMYKKKYQDLKDKVNESPSNSVSPRASPSPPSRSRQVTLKLMQKVKADLVKAKFENKLLMDYILKENLMKDKTLDELLLSGDSDDEELHSFTRRSSSSSSGASTTSYHSASPPPPRRLTSPAVEFDMRATPKPLRQTVEDIVPDTNDPRIRSPIPTASSSSKTQPISRRNSGFGSSGLIAPPSILNIPKPKKKTVNNKLVKFANSKNPKRFISTASLPAPMTPLDADNHAVKRAYVEDSEGESPQADNAVGSTNIEILDLPRKSSTPPRSPSLSPPSAQPIKKPESSSAAKRRKIETGLLKTIDDCIKTGKTLNIDEITVKDIDKSFIEIIESFSSMKSGISPDASPDSTHGIKDGFTIQVPNNFFKGEKDYAWYFSFLSTKEEFYDYIMNAIHEKIKFDVKGVKRDGIIARWIRLAALVTKSRNDSERMISLLSDVIGTVSGKKFFSNSLLNVTRAFSACLKFAENEPSLPRTLQVALAHVGNKHSADNASTIYSKIGPILEWPTMDESNALSSLIEEDLAVLNKIGELEKDDTNACLKYRKYLNRSLKLIFNVLGDWKATYNNFIISKLWPLLSGDNKVVTETVVELLGSLGSLGVSEDVLLPNKPGVDFLRETLSQITKIEDEEHKSLQEIAAASIAKLQ